MKTTDHFTPTQRRFIDVETKEVFRLYSNENSSTFKLISDGSKKFAKGTEVNGFFICSHTPCEIKINNKKIIKLDRTQFYTIKEEEKVTHKKYCGFDRFTRV